MIDVDRRLAARLGAAHLAWTLVVLGGALFCVLGGLGTTRRGEFPTRLWAVATLVAVAAVGYLVSTALVSTRYGRRLRWRGDCTGADVGGLAMGHATVAVAATWVLWLGPASRALLAGLDRYVATLAVVACLSLLLTLLVRWTARPVGVATSPTLPGSWRLVHYLFVLLLAAGLVFLEQLPLPGRARNAPASAGRWDPGRRSPEPAAGEITRSH